MTNPDLFDGAWHQRVTARTRVAIAGADGFIGSALCAALAQDHQVFALTRSPTWAQMPPDRAGVVRRVCDLFSLDEVRTGLDGIDYAVYLAHSQAPSSRLTQARPTDMDLVMADNFAHAAAEHDVKQIVVVGGLIPEGFHISRLLWSRREVEMVLASRGTPVTALRAGLVVGPGGSAVGFLVDLVRRLPVIPLPGAARSVTRPIALVDLIRAIRRCLGRPETYRGPFDLGGPDCLSYEAMVRETAAILGRRRAIIRVPLIPLGFAAWAARLVSGAPASLIGPVIESLPQDTLMRDNPLQQIIGADAIPFCQALEAALDARRRRLPNPRQPTRQQDRILLRRARLVRSIQRIILPPGQDAAWVAGNYFRWLEGGGAWPLIRSHCDQAGSVTLCLRWPRIRLLTLRHLAAQSSRQRQVYRIYGGLLCRIGEPVKARFEFQTLLGDRYTMAAIHDYAPSLPWYLYRWTQAPFHRWVMRRYQRHLARLAR